EYGNDEDVPTITRAFLQEISNLKEQAKAWRNLLSSGEAPKHVEGYISDFLTQAPYPNTHALLRSFFLEIGTEKALSKTPTSMRHYRELIPECRAILGTERQQDVPTFDLVLEICNSMLKRKFDIQAQIALQKPVIRRDNAGRAIDLSEVAHRVFGDTIFAIQHFEDLTRAGDTLSRDIPWLQRGVIKATMQEAYRLRTSEEIGEKKMGVYKELLGMVGSGEYMKALAFLSNLGYNKLK
ncbi:MAG: hypothetical protein ACMG6E_03690, partial [Candidatus Roizmanbacteria bacterium]